MSLPAEPAAPLTVERYGNMGDRGAGKPRLSPRQRQVLEEIARGYLNKEIAARLGVSTETVRTYLKIIYERLDVHSRTEAAVKFLHAGWPRR